MLTYLHPETGQPICQTCYLRVTGKKLSRRQGKCPECEQGPRVINYLHPKTKKHICHGCYDRIKRRERGLQWVPKYPDREAVIVALEERETQGKDNFPSVICQENGPLYSSALRIGVELPMKNNPPVRYYRRDLARNRNLKDPDIFGKIGEVIQSNEKEARVDFKEGKGVTRVYRKWENFNNIALHIRYSSIIITLLMKAAERESVPV